MTPRGRPRAPRGVRKHAPRRVDPGTLEKHAPLGLRGPSIVRSARHKAPRASWTGGTRRGNSARARKRASESIMARGVSRFRRQCGSRFPRIRDGEEGGENGARARGTARTRRAALGRRRSSRRCPHGRARLLFVPQARKREGGTYRYNENGRVHFNRDAVSRAPRRRARRARRQKESSPPLTRLMR